MDWQAPKGTRDFYPDETRIRDYIFDSWKNSCVKYGFEPYDAPVFEHLEVYTQKSGDEIEGQLYTFEDKAGRKLALRPEMTPSLARMIAAKGQELKKPIKWYSIPKLFRYEKMQKGRLREFFQLNMDILGVDDVCADAELIAAAINMLCDLGLSSDDFQVHISSRTLLERLFLFVGVNLDDLAKLYAILDKMHKVSFDDFCLMIDEFFADKKVAQSVKKILSAKNIDEISAINSDIEPIKEINQMFERLQNLGFSDYIEFDVSVVRGLAYYTGVVFEIFDKKRTMRAIAGGGRYDKLVELYGGQPTPAVGFAVGDVVLSDLLKELGKLPEIKQNCDLFIVSFDKDYSNVLKTVKRFRDANLSVQYPLKLGNFGRQMKQADGAGAKIVLFIGGEEEKNGNYKIKIMETGEERVVSMDNIVNLF
ncbi:MAG: histidine--tRNA ligase [Chitinispirillales bacterium]|jgi:histidyl-tRNA synthetase|nr:histidine--tRNA ligase [Chitinispirillales bacterium]